MRRTNYISDENHDKQYAKHCATARNEAMN